MSRTTIETLTAKQITDLRAEAATAGDTKTVRLCDRARDRNDLRAMEKIVEIIRNNEAQND